MARMARATKPPIVLMVQHLAFLESLLLRVSVCSAYSSNVQWKVSYLDFTQSYSLSKLIIIFYIKGKIRLLLKPNLDPNVEYKILLSL